MPVRRQASSLGKPSPCELFLDEAGKVRRRVRLGEKRTGVGYVFAAEPHCARGDDDLDVRPTLGYFCGEVQAVYIAWHVDVGEDEGDPGRLLQNRHSFIRVSRFKDRITAILKRIDRDHADEDLILNHENGKFGSIHADITRVITMRCQMEEIFGIASACLYVD